MKEYRINCLVLKNGHYDVKVSYCNNENALKRTIAFLKRNKDIFYIDVWTREVTQWDHLKLQQK